MSNVRPSESPTRIPLTVAIVLVTLVLALVLSVTAVVQVFEEYRLLGHWLARPGPVPADEIDALRQDIGARIIVRSIVSAVLLLCTPATLWRQQHQFAIRRTLDQVKLLSHDILASLNHGVITSNQELSITSINAAAVDLLGIDHECIGRPVASITSAEVPLEGLCLGVTRQ